MMVSALQHRFLGWDDELVFDRLVEAFDTLRRLPGGLLRPGVDDAAYLAPIRNFADVVGAEETRDPKKWHPSFYRPSPPEGDAVDRMNEAFAWPMSYLSDEPGMSRVLLSLAQANAVRMPVTKLCRIKRWSRRTIYKRRAEALGLITAGLTRDVVPVRAAEKKD